MGFPVVVPYFTVDGWFLPILAVYVFSPKRGNSCHSAHGDVAVVHFRTHIE
jgi:hypothetical protein